MKKITVPTLALLAATPVSVGLSTVLMSSCSNGNQLIKPAETQLVANENNIAWVEVEFSEQPKYNEAMVHIESKSDVQLEIIDGQNSYETIDTVRVDDKKALVIVGVKEKQTKSVNVDFDLTFSYVNQNNKAITSTINNMKIKVDVDPTQLTDEVHILDINDFHGAVPGYGSLNYKAAYNEPGALRLARDTHNIIKQYPGSIFLSAGDANSGNVFSVATHGETLYPILKAMDVQYSAVGNHAFEWGLDYMAAEKFDQWARTPTTSGKYFIASNILNTPNYSSKVWVYDPTQKGYEDDYHIWKNQIVSWADPYKLLNLKGHRVCVIGLTTQKTEEDGNTEVTKHLSFIDYLASVNYAKQYCLENIGQEDFNRIESFILLTHVESDYSNPDKPTGAAIDLAKKLDTPVDAIISAHSHKVGTAKIYNDKIGKDIWVGQAGKHGMNFMDTKLVFDNTKATGSKLTEIEMNIKTPSIDYGGYDPKTVEGRASAGKEYQQLLNNPTDAFNKNVSEEYQKQSIILDQALSEEYATSEFGQTYDLQTLTLGHDYIEFDNVLEQMGAWVNRACLYGFKNLITDKNKANSGDAPEPWISFMNQDSITHNWEKDDKIKKKDMFAVQTYENKAVVGYMTIGQIVNIVDYLLSGWYNFNYDENKVYTGRLNGDVMGNKCSGVNLEDDGLPENTSNYLCGPLQWYGFSVELEEIYHEEGTPLPDPYYKTKIVKKIIGTGEYTIPQIKFYDPTLKDASGKQKCNLEDPTTWEPAETYIVKEIESGAKTFIPVLINDFIYEGKLASNRMFKQYFLYTATFDKTKSPVIYSQISRDLLINFSENWKNHTDIIPTFDINPDIVKSLVVGFTRKTRPFK